MKPPARTKRKNADTPSELRPRRTAAVRLTPIDAVHLRDLFSIMLPPDGARTVSQSLAASTGRALVESRLWQKLQAACVQLSVPLGDDAPDFVVVPTAVPMPELAVQQVEVQAEQAVSEQPDILTLISQDENEAVDVVPDAAPRSRSSSKKTKTRTKKEA